MTLRGWRQADHEQRPVQFLLTKPFRNAQTYPKPPRSTAYRTVSLPVWQDAYRHVDTVVFLGDDFCTPLGVYVASLLHGVRECMEGGGGAMCVPHVPFTVDIPSTMVGSHCWPLHELFDASVNYSGPSVNYSGPSVNYLIPR